MNVRLHHVAVIVEDVSRAKNFYREVFRLEEMERLTRSVSQHNGAWFHLGPLELHLQERAGSKDEKSDQHFAVVTDDFDALCERAVKCGGKLEEAKLVGSFTKRKFLRDLDGNRIELLAE